VLRYPNTYSPVIAENQGTPTEESYEDEVVQQSVYAFVEPVIKELKYIVEENNDCCLCFWLVT
jgi:hypothetical protein